jgi:NIMA (never in mitosis gene a)-related kinase
MHDKHVLHRDLKSQNLFLTSSDRLRVGDFGISKVLESTAAFAKTAIGTPYYLSPEICQEKPYSFGSDVWALGCVVYECCALRVPFDAQNIQMLVQKITRGPLPQVPAHYTQELRQLCGDLLHRDQTQRPTATDIIQRRFVQDEIRRMLIEERAKAAAHANGPAANGQAVSAPGTGPPGGPSGSPSPASAMVRQPSHRPSSYRASYSPSQAYVRPGPGSHAPSSYAGAPLAGAPSPGQYAQAGQAMHAAQPVAQYPSRQVTPVRRF